MSLPLPNYTQIPNAILDNLEGLKNGEVKLILAICRNTLGYHRVSHRLSIGFLELSTGLTRPTIVSSVKTLIEKGWIERHPASCSNGSTFEYEINIIEGVKKFNQLKNLTSKKNEPLTSKKIKPVLVKKFNPLNKELNKEEKKEDPPFPPKEDSGQSQEELPATGGQTSRRNLMPTSSSMIYGCYQGSSEFMDERPWMTKWHRANPKYVDGFPQAIMDYLKGIDDNPERVNLARAIGYLAAANKETPEGIERLQKIYAIWLEFSEGVGDTGLTDKQATAQILKHLDRLNATVVLDSSWAAPQGARLVSDLSGEHLNAYLKHLKSIPTPQEVSHAA